MNTHALHTLSRLGKPAKGFTLIELMVVIAIMAILLSLAVPSMSRFLAQWQLKSAVNAFSGSMRQARSEAIKSTRMVTVCPKVANAENCAGNVGDWVNGWVVYLDLNNNGQKDANEQVLQVKDGVAGMNTVTVTGGRTAFSFMPSGLLRSQAGNMTFTPSNAEVNAKQVVISATGRMRVQ